MFCLEAEKITVHDYYMRSETEFDIRKAAENHVPVITVTLT